MTTQEAADVLGVSAIRVRQLIGNGRLKAKRMGRDWHITPAALRAVSIRKTGRPRTRTVAEVRS